MSRRQSTRRASGRGYAAQEMDAAPVGPHDVPLDAIATEFGIIRGKKA